MNRFTAILASSALWFSLGPNAFAADIYFTPGGGAEPNSCGEVSNEIPTVTSSGGIDNETGFNLRCITDIDALRLTLHKAGLCTSAPDTNDPSADWADKCVFIIDDATGIEFTVTETSSSAIPANKIDLSSLVEATYTHAILMVGNSVKTKMNAKFSEDFRGANGNGSFCYSINAVAPINAPAALTDLAVNCVANEAAMIAAGDHDFSEKVFETFPAGGGTHTASRTATNGDRIHLFKDLSTKATVATNGSASDATKVVGVMEMTNPAVLSAASTTFSAGFQMSDQGQIRFSGDGVCRPGTIRATACISSMRNYGVGFRVTIE